ncbi:SpoIID/LytB domain-containing protein [Paenibacillus terrigena]|uniref:SpoIID/LytB domain-containing protein n=1 Tax=Paenibacillus terrigena TaxID=369333 RepID=UPI0028D6D8E8|nr:SpoIID/LytB domain-containing protein [Paenibacillus terrigena]
MYLLGRGRARSFMGKVGLAAILTLSVATTPMMMNSISAKEATASEQADQIRVVIFADLGSQYKAIQSTVTLTSASGFQIGVQGDPWLNASANQSVKFGLDAYAVKVLETTDTREVNGVVNRLQAMKEAPSVMMMRRQGVATYQIVLGDYVSAAEASKVRDRVTTDAGLAAYYKKDKPVITGNLHLGAGSYGSEQQAAAVQQKILDAGMDAYIAITKTGGGLQFAVWVGQAADQAELNALRNQAAQKLPGMSLQPVDASQMGLLARDNVTVGYANGSEPIPHYSMSGSAGAKLWINGSSSGIKLSERSNRTYRGSFEITAYNNRLALVNELPLEQYLYSVVAMEVSPSWPAESLKAQAVAARTYALFQDNKFKIGQVVDTTLSQAYYGMDKEHPNTNAAVEATAGFVMKVGGKLIEPVYSSNSGGKTADSSEIWGNKTSYLVSVDSPDDVAEKGLPNWYRVMLSDNTTGYVREDLVKDSGRKTDAGLPIYTITTDGTNLREIPLIQADVKPVAIVNIGTEVVILDKTIQSNTMHWIRGPYTSDELVKAMSGKSKTPVGSSIARLEVSGRGPSDRVTEIKVNGQVFDVKNPDTLRSALNGLPSTRFDIEETGSYTILGANGATRTLTSSNGKVQAATSKGNTALNPGSNLIMGGHGQVHVITGEALYRFIGTGNGHGVGMSQWGAKGLADQGYDYQSILQYYYKDINLVKE